MFGLFWRRLQKESAAYLTFVCFKNINPSSRVKSISQINFDFFNCGPTTKTICLSTNTVTNCDKIPLRYCLNSSIFLFISEIVKIDRIRKNYMKWNEQEEESVRKVKGTGLPTSGCRIWISLCHVTLADLDDCISTDDRPHTGQSTTKCIAISRCS